MIQIGEIKIGWCGYKINIGGVPKQWEPYLSPGLRGMKFIEISVAAAALIAGAFGVFSIISLILAALLFIEIASFDIRRGSTIIQSQEHGGEGAHWEFDPPLEPTTQFYIDEHGEPIPSEESPVACSDHIKIEIPPGAYENMDNTGLMRFDFPIPVDHITVVKDWD